MSGRTPTPSSSVARPSRRAAARARGLALAFPLLLPLSACGGSAGPIDGSKTLTHVQKFVEIGPRPFGSDALGKTADYITSQLTAMGLEPKRHEVMHEQEKKLIRNLYVEIPGGSDLAAGKPEERDGPILMIGGHYDTKVATGHSDAAHNFPFVGAIDGGGAPAVLIELARHLADPKNRPDCTVWLYWIDAEESIDWNWNDDRALLGSKAFCKWLSETKVLKRVKAFVLLDLIGSKNFKIDKDGNSVPDLQDIFARAADALGERHRLYEFPTDRDIAAYSARNLKWGTKDDHEIFTNYGVSSVLLIDFARRIPPALQNLGEGQEPLVDPDYEQWWHTPDDNLDAVDPAALAFAGNLVVKALPELAKFVQSKVRRRKSK